MAHRKKTVFFLEQYSQVSGGQKVLLQVISGLNKEEYAPVVVLPDQGELSLRLKRLGASIVIAPMGYYTASKKNLPDAARYFFRLPLLVYFLCRELRRYRPALVYANAARTFIWGTVGCFFSGVPMVWHVHSIFTDWLPSSVFILLGRMRTVKKIIAVSGAARKPLRRVGAKIETVYNGVDTACFCPGGEGGLRHAGQKITVAAAGLLIAWKNQEDLIKAAGFLCKESHCPRFQALIIGRPLLSDRQSRRYQRELKDLSRRLGLEQKVIFTGHKDGMEHVLRTIDILVLTSRKPDPCPLILLEAMACGVAVIATDFGGPAEIISPGEDGLLYPAGDCRKLAEYIFALSGRPQERRRLGKNARRKAEKYFNQEVFTEKVTRIIKGCAK